MYDESMISFPGLGIDEFVLNRVAFSFNIGSHTFTVMTDFEKQVPIV